MPVEPGLGQVELEVGKETTGEELVARAWRMAHVAGLAGCDTAFP